MKILLFDENIFTEAVTGYAPYTITFYNGLESNFAKVTMAFIFYVITYIFFFLVSSLVDMKKKLFCSLIEPDSDPIFFCPLILL